MYEKLRVFYSNKENKEKYLNKIKDYTSISKMLGVEVPKYNYYLYQTELGIPADIGVLLDSICHILPDKESKEFSYKFIESLNVGSNLEDICTKIKIYILSDKDYGAINRIKTNKEDSKFCIKAVKEVSDLLQKQLTENIDKEYLTKISRNVYEGYCSKFQDYESRAICHAAWFAIHDNTDSISETLAYAQDRSNNSGYYIRVKDKLIELISEEKECLK